jgi:hypothetical protein
MFLPFRKKLLEKFTLLVIRFTTYCVLLKHFNQKRFVGELFPSLKRCFIKMSSFSKPWLKQKIITGIFMTECLFSCDTQKQTY